MYVPDVGWADPGALLDPGGLHPCDKVVVLDEPKRINLSISLLLPKLHS